MANGLFKNYRVYILTSVAYMGSLLFGKPLHSRDCSLSARSTIINMIPLHVTLT